ncbi:molybdopterin-binding protein [Methanoculleus bourgensis]|uniref:Molybdopterin molybdotransferase n=1 Tax=Methanoculleus bourgensis TaxID=83986 RepID=A0A0X3BM79_9EURY|nr:molybdopterin-binding protein [Methanoculleus bourgensis]CVK33178.1 protein of unknown function [Methanoculleus bourgensis]
MLRQAIAKGVRENDLLLVSAGSSAGTRDFTAGVIGDLGEVLVHGIAMKPGKPAIIGRVDGKPVIGMPGYPIAAMTTVRELALPLLVEWGFCAPYGERLHARLARTVQTDPGFDEYVFLTVSRSGDRYIATPLPRGAGTQMTVVRANAYLHVPPGTGSIHEGAEVEILLTGPRALIRESPGSRRPRARTPGAGSRSDAPAEELLTAVLPDQLRLPFLDTAVASRGRACCPDRGVGRSSTLLRVASRLRAS